MANAKRDANGMWEVISEDGDHATFRETRADHNRIPSEREPPAQPWREDHRTARNGGRGRFSRFLYPIAGGLGPGAAQRLLPRRLCRSAIGASDTQSWQGILMDGRSTTG